ncbi:hypothetical protein DPMN_180180 [Dreissena polymorpha]|uniref:Uncharacterized protein n=1 Tax=Dreissena polymorpha TaxID=45954 RepID=A0A9D4EII6_DREPO|nr:hypothetical protein DPMN_180180 [Dreissena polymorpha]
MEITPVSKAVARHLGIDLSPEGKAARNRRGIAVIVHGAPLSGMRKSVLIITSHGCKNLNQATPLKCYQF